MDSARKWHSLASYTSCLFVWHSRSNEANDSPQSKYCKMGPKCTHATAGQIRLRKISGIVRVPYLGLRPKIDMGPGSWCLYSLSCHRDLAKPDFKSLCPSQKPPRARRAPHSPVHLRRLPLDFRARFHHLFGNLTTAKDKNTHPCTDIQSRRGMCTCSFLTSQWSYPVLGPHTFSPSIRGSFYGVWGCPWA